ncbi:MAG TPA: hypothetical protein ENF35_04080 [Aciduliprofundum sp.]|nr:hypothetical protein [Aciduliprofundum sp.]
MRSSPLVRYWSLYVPILVGLAYYALLALILPKRASIALMSLFPASFIPPVGKNAILPAVYAVVSRELGEPMAAVIVAVTSIIIDLLMGAYVTLNFDYLKKVPKLGKAIEAGTRKLEIIFHRGTMRKITFSFLVLFVMVPISGTGAVWASVLGRLMGFRPRMVLTAVFLGSSILNAMIISTVLVGEALRMDIELLVVILFVAFLLITVIGGAVVWKRLSSQGEPAS